MIRILFLFLLLTTASHALAQGLVPHNVPMDSINTGFYISPTGAGIPINPSGSIPFAFGVDGDMIAGDHYCLDDMLGPWYGWELFGCAYGLAPYGMPAGPRLYMSNKHITSDDGTGGPGIVMWPDRPNIDASGNSGYMDVYAWSSEACAEQGGTDFNNSISFGNRDTNSGAPHRRFHISCDGTIKLYDLTQQPGHPAVERLCIGPDGTLMRGGC